MKVICEILPFENPSCVEPGSSLPSGLCNDNDELSQLVRPRTLIGQDHQV